MNSLKARGKYTGPKDCSNTNAEKDIIESYAKLDGIDWQGLLKSGYLEKISRYERRIMNYRDKLFKKFIGRLYT